jgi:hypothetical protein
LRVNQARSLSRAGVQGGGPLYMDMVVRGKLEMVARVREFIRAHLAAEPGYSPILLRLEEGQGRAIAIAAREQEGRTASRGARAHRRELRRVLHFQVIRYLVAIGSVAARDQIELAERFKLTSSNMTNATFIASVRALLVAAESQRSLLMEAGMKEGVLEGLSTKVVEMEAAIETARTGLREHIGARADLDVVTAELLELVKVLDGMTRYSFGDNPDIMAEWNAVKRLPPSRGKGKAPAKDAPGPTPPGGVAPAA